MADTRTPDAQAVLDAATVERGWREAAIAWEVCASIHREYAKGKDPFFKTRQADFVKHATEARATISALSAGAGGVKDRLTTAEPIVRCGEPGASRPDHEWYVRNGESYCRRCGFTEPTPPTPEPPGCVGCQHYWPAIDPGDNNWCGKLNISNWAARAEGQPCGPTARLYVKGE